MKSKLIREFKSKNGQVFPKNFEFEIMVPKELPVRAILQKGSFHAHMQSKNLHLYFEGFQEYSEEDIATAMMDGRCFSLTGEDVEPDGWDSKGFPSILLAEGLS